MPGASTAQVTRQAAAVVSADTRRSQRSATVKIATARSGPALLTNGVNCTPASVDATNTAAHAAAAGTGHTRRGTSAAAASPASSATVQDGPAPARGTSSTGTVKAVKQPAAIS